MDETVIGAPFIVVERRRGVVIRDTFPAEMLNHEDLAERTSYALVDAMAELHQVDANAIGLGKLGRPEGFVARQLSGWADRWQRARDTDVPLFGEIHRLLEHHLPEPQRTSIVHNDLKLDNCQFDAHNPDRVQSIFDWDMATLGDPEPRARQASGASDTFPTRAQIAQRYAASSGLDLSRIPWYEAFALWKTAVVVQQIHIRFKRAQTQDTRFATYNERVPNLLQQAHALL